MITRQGLFHIKFLLHKAHDLRKFCIVKLSKWQTMFTELSPPRLRHYTNCENPTIWAALNSVTTNVIRNSVCQFPVLHFFVRQISHRICPPFSRSCIFHPLLVGPSLTPPAMWYIIFRSCIFSTPVYLISVGTKGKKIGIYSSRPTQWH